jgi:hypothetical protein
MIGADGFVIFPHPAGWRLGFTRAGSPIVQPIAGGSDGAATALKAAGHRGGGVVLALPSEWCLAAPVDTAGLPAKDRRRAMTYRLEEKLPVAAEEVVADFVPAPPTAATVFGVCTRTAELAPLVQSLEAAGIDVTAVCPASLLALQNISDKLEAVLWPSDTPSRVELFTFRDGQLHGWYVLPDDPKDVLLHVEHEFPQSTTIAVHSDIKSFFARHPGLRVAPLKSPSAAATATAMAVQILSGKATPWIDLRRDAVAPRDRFRPIRTPLTCAAVAAVLCLLCAVGAMLWRAGRYDDLAARLADDQRLVYRKAFPNAPIPDDVRSRLESEERSLRGVSGDASAPPPDDAGLVTLRDLMAHLPPPTDLRYRILELRLDKDRFTLEGQAPAHADADAIAAALRQRRTFEVEPPRTERLPSGDANAATGVSFTLTGTRGASR